MAPGWLNLEAATAGSNLVPDAAFFEGDSAFKFLQLSKTARLYGFIAWYGSSSYWMYSLLK